VLLFGEPGQVQVSVGTFQSSPRVVRRRRGASTLGQTRRLLRFAPCSKVSSGPPRDRRRRRPPRARPAARTRERARLPSRRRRREASSSGLPRRDRRRSGIRVAGTPTTSRMGTCPRCSSDARTCSRRPRSARTSAPRRYAARDPSLSDSLSARVVRAGRLNYRARRRSLLFAP
jgi:hypothetical protein